MNPFLEGDASTEHPSVFAKDRERLLNGCGGYFGHEILMDKYTCKYDYMLVFLPNRMARPGKRTKFNWR